MGLSDAVQGARYIAQEITWTDEDGTPVDLTGATLTGYKRDLKTKLSSALDGVLTLVTPADGVFSWAYGETDVETPGTFQVQFVATYGGGLAEKTFLESWIVHDALDD